MAGGFSIPGIGSGIDWSTYITSITNAEQQAIANTLGKRQAITSAQQAAIGNIKGIMEDLKGPVNGFEYAKDFKTKTVNSTDPTVVTGTATVTASEQTVKVHVEQLASNEVWKASFTGVNDSVTTTDQTLTINVRGTNRSLAVTAGTTLQQLADKITAQGWGISATAYNTGVVGPNPAQLVITDNSSGKNDTANTAGVYNLGFTSTLTALSTGSFSNLIEGLDSEIWINSVSTNIVRRDNNTFDNAFPGLTLTVKSTNTAGSAASFETVQVASNTDGAASKITAFIEKYNAAVTTIRGAVAYDLTGTTQSPTAGNGTLRSVLDQLTNSVTSTVNELPAENTIRSLADLGITSVYSKDSPATNGTLTFDTDKFNKALADHYDEVVQFFEGKSVGTVGQLDYEGFGKKIGHVMDSFLNATDGALTTKIKSLGQESDRLTTDIQTKLKRIADKEDVLKAKFARLESTLSQLNGQQSQLSSALSSVALNSQAIASKK